MGKTMFPYPECGRVPDIDPAELESRDAYKLLVSTVIPRPIAWVSTLNREGVGNLAPYSFYSAFSADPPILGLGVGRRRVPGNGDEPDVVPKDTLWNIRETGEFVVNFVSEALMEAMNASAAEHAPHVDEFDDAGLARAESKVVKPARVADAPVALECVLWDEVDLRESRARPARDARKSFITLVLGEVVSVHVRDDVLDPETGLPDPRKVAPVARLGGAEYWRGGEVFSMPRPPRPDAK